VTSTTRRPASLLTSSHKYLATSTHHSFSALQSMPTPSNSTIPINSNVQRNAQNVTNNQRNPAKSKEDGPAHAREIPQRHLTPPPVLPQNLTTLRSNGQSSSNRRQRRLHRRALLLRHGQRTSRLRYGIALSSLSYPTNPH
jgi:hypothetical protein